MDKLSELTQATIAALLRDYYLWIGILTVILAFALYVYFRPNAMEFFTGSAKKEAAPAHTLPNGNGEQQRDVHAAAAAEAT
jgi:hypothetical protein